MRARPGAGAQENDRRGADPRLRQEGCLARSLPPWTWVTDKGRSSPGPGFTSAKLRIKPAPSRLWEPEGSAAPCAPLGEVRVFWLPGLPQLVRWLALGYRMGPQAKAGGHNPLVQRVCQSWSSGSLPCGRWHQWRWPCHQQPPRGWLPAVGTHGSFLREFSRTQAHPHCTGGSQAEGAQLGEDARPSVPRQRFHLAPHRCSASSCESSSPALRAPPQLCAAEMVCSLSWKASSLCSDRSLLVVRPSLAFVRL